MSTNELRLPGIDKAKPKPNRLVLAGIYALALLAAVWIRIHLAPDAFSDPLSNAFDSDSARVFRLIGLIVNDYPSLPMFDAFANFPWGMTEQLPPLWAFVLASIGVLLHRVAGISAIQGASIVPVFLGLLLAYPAYFATRGIFDRAAGHAAALTSLFLPIAVAHSATGMVDHHIADLVLYTAMIALIMAAHKGLMKRPNPKALLVAIGAGAVLTMTLLISLSSILIVFALTLAFLIGVLLLPEDERERSSIAGAVTLATSAITFWLLFFFTPWFSPRLSFTELSFFQPVMLSVLSLCVTGSVLLDGALQRRRALAFAGVYSLIALAALLIPGFGNQMIRGFYRSLGWYPLGTVTQELIPLFKEGLVRPYAHFSIAVLTSPLGFILCLYECVAIKRSLTFGRLLFLAWFAIAFFFMASSSYHAYFFTPAAIVSSGFALSRVAKRLARSLGRFHQPSLGRSRLSIDFAAWSIASVATLSFLLIFDYQAIALQRYPGLSRMAMWIKDNTPAAGSTLNARSKAEYGIASDWAYGEHIELLAERPTLATGNHEKGLKGIITSYRLFQAGTEQEAVAIMKKHRLRYILKGPEGYPVWFGDLSRIGEPAANPSQIAFIGNQSVGFEQRLGYRLHHYLGTGDPQKGIEPLERFRLVYMVGSSEYTAFTLFELVQGAKLEIQAAAGTTVTVSTNIRYAEGRSMHWKATRIADENGKASLRLPYATESPRYPVVADDFEIRTPDKTAYVQVTEEDVAKGTPKRVGM